LNTIYLYGYNETATRLCETVRCLTREADVTAAILEEYRRDPRRALTDEGVVCLVCGRLFRHLTNTHLRSHGLTSEQYKATFGYNVRRALMVTSLRTVHALNALRADLASWIRRRAILEDPTLRRRGPTSAPGRGAADAPGARSAAGDVGAAGSTWAVRGELAFVRMRAKMEEGTGEARSLAGSPGWTRN
jgi:hypothetical protein